MREKPRPRCPVTHKGHRWTPSPIYGTNPDGSARWWVCDDCGERIRYMWDMPITVRAR
jgi:hypothetical protein